jgi:hypothetical protein
MFNAMPIVPFERLPDESRIWVFGSDRPLTNGDAERLLGEVDRFLNQWKAHGVPLTCARDWRDEHLLTVGVDRTQENASGCSIDGLFRVLQGIERPLGTRLVGGGRVFYRASDGSVQCVERGGLPQLAATGVIGADTRVFDTGLTNAGDWRDHFEAPARESWVGKLLVGGGR